jgi:hypothetical protein
MSYCSIKGKQGKKSKSLLFYGKELYKEILYTDEKKFTVEETFNKLNDRVYAWSCKETCKLLPRFERGHYYQQDILTNLVEPLNQKIKLCTHA